MKYQLREELEDFANFMEKVLRENDYKGERVWEDMPIEDLIKRMQQEMDELKIAFYCHSNPDRLENIQKECADVANFAMMTYDLVKLYRRAANVNPKRLSE